MPEREGFFSIREREQIASAISSWHEVTAGEIRIYVDKTSGNDIVTRANEIYESLGLHNLPRRNGALLYIAAEDGVLLVLGGAGINKKVLPGFWDRIRKLVEKAFIDGRYLEGALLFIDRAGSILRKFFPEKIPRKHIAMEKYNPVEAPDLSPAEQYRMKIQRLRKRNAKRLIRQWYSLSEGHGRYSANYQKEHNILTFSLVSIFLPLISYLSLVMCFVLIMQSIEGKAEWTPELKYGFLLSLFGSIVWTLVLTLAF